MDLRNHVEILGREASLARHGCNNLYQREGSHTVLEMETTEIDDYLDFCETAFVGEKAEFEPIKHMFRARGEDGDAYEAAEWVNGASVADLEGNDDGYKAWSTLVVESAARETGWTVEAIAGSVERVERRLGRWWKRRKVELEEQVIVV